MSDWEISGTLSFIAFVLFMAQAFDDSSLLDDKFVFNLKSICKGIVLILASPWLFVCFVVISVIGGIGIIAEYDLSKLFKKRKAQ